MKYNSCRARTCVVTPPLHVYTYIYIYIYVYVCLSLSLYIYIYIYIYIHTYTYFTIYYTCTCSLCQVVKLLKANMGQVRYLEAESNRIVYQLANKHTIILYTSILYFIILYCSVLYHIRVKYSEAESKRVLDQVRASTDEARDCLARPNIYVHLTQLQFSHYVLRMLSTHWCDRSMRSTPVPGRCVACLPPCSDRAYAARRCSALHNGLQHLYM